MSVKTGFNKSYIGAGAALALSLLTCLAVAQDAVVEAVLEEDSEENIAEEVSKDDSQSETSIEEIMVLAPFPDGPLSLDPFYDDPLNARIRKEIELLMADPEAEDWRAELAEETDARIKFGYDPRDEYRLRNEIELNPQLNGTVKPATILRFEF